MALNIRNRDTDELAQALADLTGEIKTKAVTTALRERLEREQRQRSGRGRANELTEIAAHCAALPVRDERDADEILGYDDRGLPN